MACVAPDPAKDGEVGNRQLVSKVAAACQAAVHHAIQALGFVHEARQTVALVGIIFQRHKVMHLPRRRAKSTHLKH